LFSVYFGFGRAEDLTFDW